MLRGFYLFWIKLFSSKYPFVIGNITEVFWVRPPCRNDLCLVLTTCCVLMYCCMIQHGTYLCREQLPVHGVLRPPGVALPPVEVELAQPVFVLQRASFHRCTRKIFGSEHTDQCPILWLYRRVCHIIVYNNVKGQFKPQWGLWCDCCSWYIGTY